MATTPESTPDPPLYDLVVIGSSAGGIEALIRLVAALPAAFPAPIVLAQHLDPTRQSHLGEILARRTSLAVRQVEEGTSQPLQPGTIYVVPADRDVEITDDAVHLRKDAIKRPRPSVDVLLSSAARTHGERTIAVILTGTGSDGAAGAREVKAAGGMVIIENPATAAYPSMPASLARSTVDLAVDLERIGPLLFDVLAGAYGVPPPNAQPDGTLDGLLAAIGAHTGIDFSHYKQATILRRIQRRMAATGMRTLYDYSHYVEGHPDEYARLAASFLINVTEFFRDKGLFAHLGEQVIPDLITYARTHGNRLRIWSAGCATGEEAYSLALLIADQLGSELEHFTIHIFATDADTAAIAFARRGIYPAASLARLPDHYKARYFTEVEGGYLIDRRVRSLVVFGEHDLGKRAPFPDIDLVLCRNVLIYFTPELQRRALQLFAFSLRHDGYLILGSSESTSVLPEYFAPVERHFNVYRRQGGRVLVTMLPPAPARILPSSWEKAKPSLAPPAKEVQAPDDPLAEQTIRPKPRTMREELGEQILGLVGTGVVVVDRNYDVQVINSAAYALLDIVHAAHGKDLLHLAERVPTKPLRAAIDAALRSAPLDARQATLTLELAEGESRRLRITCYPHLSRGVGEDEQGQMGAVDAVLLTITDVTAEPSVPLEVVGPREARENSSEPPAPAGRGRQAAELLAGAQQAGELERVTWQLERAQASIRELRAANQDLHDANQQLLRDNDELMVRQEEGQAAAEQARTLNEEMQAVNEEMETLNEEMEATLEQLRTTNDDLQARAEEQEELLREREIQRQESERERVRLAAILASMSDALLVVDTAGTPVLTNAAYDQLMGASAAPALVDWEGAPLPEEASPRRRALEGTAFTMECGLRREYGTQRWLEARGEPLHGEDGDFLGAVIAIRDITERSTLAAQERFLTLVSHELRDPLTTARMALQLLAKRLGAAEQPGESRQLVTLALRAVDSLSALVSDLIDLASARHGKLALQRRRVDLAALVRQGIDDLNVVDRVAEGMDPGAAPLPAPTPHIQFHLVPETTGPLWMQGDPVRLEQILRNLLINALSHAATATGVEVTLASQGDWAELRVQDNGPGIAPADLPRIFTPYFQAQTRAAETKLRGLGLGLYLVAELVKAHAGSIRVESAPTGGALFVARFPLDTSGAQHEEPLQREPVTEYATLHEPTEDKREAASQ